jgi:hypothetical protein
VCTVVVSFAPGERVPLRLLGVRDELASRPWLPPARHWPGLPLVGGLDEQAGGTWLAVNPGVPGVACLLNGRGPMADPAHRRSRGDLPLRAAAEGRDLLTRLAADPEALAAYDPFHLICATPDSVTALTWPGRGLPVSPEGPASGAGPAEAASLTLTTRDLAPGTHLFTNAGHAYPADPAHPGDPAGEPKAAHFAEKFAAARPSADPALPVGQAWGDWLTLAGGDGLPGDDPGAIVVRRDLPDGRLYASTSVTLVGLSADGLRYDFQPRPGHPDGWYPVAL